MFMKFAIIKERKNPPDRRVVFSPEACVKLLATYPEAEIAVESSDLRVFDDEAYREKGLAVKTSLDDSEVLFGVKEVPVEALLANKTYFFFSHTIKKQPYNRKLLRAMLDKNITFYDHETIVNEKGNRLIGFGYYAGVVGAYNTIRAYGLKYETFNLPKASTLKNKLALEAELRKITLPKIKIVMTGDGRVGKGAKEILDFLGVKKVTPKEYLEQAFEEPVYTQLKVLNYNRRKDGQILDKYDFFNHPSAYESTFMEYAATSDMYLACHYYGDGAPYIFTRSDAKSPGFKIKVVGDISCDIDGPVASTIRASTIADPIYGYNPHTEQEVDFKAKDAIVVMAVDNLPCELPDNASRGFGNLFLTHVIPAFFNGDQDGVLQRSMMCTRGKLTENYAYLQDYVDGKE